MIHHAYWNDEIEIVALERSSISLQEVSRRGSWASVVARTFQEYPDGRGKFILAEKYDMKPGPPTRTCARKLRWMLTRTIPTVKTNI
jgi:hypothetical protein